MMRSEEMVAPFASAADPGCSAAHKSNPIKQTAKQINQINAEYWI